MELGCHHIRVNAVSLAVVATPIYEGLIEKDQVHDALQGFNGSHPIGRIGTADDVTEVIRIPAFRKGCLGHGHGAGCGWGCHGWPQSI